MLFMNVCFCAVYSHSDLKLAVLQIRTPIIQVSDVNLYKLHNIKCIKFTLLKIKVLKKIIHSDAIDR